jgi:cytochrome c biogenesis protein
MSQLTGPLFLAVIVIALSTAAGAAKSPLSVRSWARTSAILAVVMGLSVIAAYGVSGSYWFSMIVGVLALTTMVNSKLHSAIISMKLAIILLIIIAVASLIGVLILQNAPQEVYIEKYGRVKYEILWRLGFLDVFGSYWYKLLLLTLCFTVSFCAISRLRNTVRLALTTSFRTKPSHYDTLMFSDKIPKRGVSRETWVRKIGDLFGGYRSIDSEHGTAFYLSKGGVARFGPSLTHFSLVFLLAGTVVTLAFGFRYYSPYMSAGDILPVTEEDFRIRVDEVEQEVDLATGAVKDYKTTLTVIDDEKEVRTKTIEVNDPLKYKGVRFYQYGMAPSHDSIKEARLTLIENSGEFDQTDGAANPEAASPAGPAYSVEAPFGKRVEIEGTDYEVEVREFLADFAIDPDTKTAFTRSMDHRNPAVNVEVFRNGESMGTRWVFIRFPEFGHWAEDLGFTLIFDDYVEHYVTRLEVAKSPGLDLIWIGFAIMGMGLILSFYFSHYRLWVFVPAPEDEPVLVGASCRREPYRFEKEYARKISSLRRIPDSSDGGAGS